MIKQLIGWYDGLSGPVKGWLGGLGAAVGGAAVDTAIQELTSNGAPSIASLDPKQIGAIALVAGLVYVQGHWKGLFRYPDGQPVYVAPQGSTVVKTDGSTTEVETPRS